MTTVEGTATWRCHDPVPKHARPPGSLTSTLRHSLSRRPIRSASQDAARLHPEILTMSVRGPRIF